MMSVILRISLLIFSISLIVVTTYVLRNGKIPIKYSLLWYFCSIIILVLSIFPSIIEFVANLIGFKTLSNLVIAIIISLLLFLTMALTIIVSDQNKKITLLVQEISLLKQKNDK